MVAAPVTLKPMKKAALPRFPGEKMWPGGG